MKRQFKNIGEAIAGGVAFESAGEVVRRSTDMLVAGRVERITQPRRRPTVAPASRATAVACSPLVQRLLGRGIVSLPAGSRSRLVASACAVFAFLLLTAQAFGATVTGPVQDAFNASRSKSIQFTPVTVPQLVNGTTYFGYPVATNLDATGNFAAKFNFGGLVNITLRPPNDDIPTVLGWIPPDNNTYNLGQVISMATNLFSISNAPAFAVAGATTNVTATLSNGVWIISVSNLLDTNQVAAIAADQAQEATNNYGNKVPVNMTNSLNQFSGTLNGTASLAENLMFSTFQFGPNSFGAGPSGVAWHPQNSDDAISSRNGLNYILNAGFFGNGANLSNLNGTNITSGTIPSTAFDSTALTLTTNIALQMSQNVVNSGIPSYLAQQGVTVEQFGAKADGRAAYDFSLTNGSAIVYSATANFTSSDIGKSFCGYYLLNNTNWISTTIVAVPSSHQLQLAANCTVTAVGQEGRWGTDNTTNFANAINWCLTNNVHNIYFNNGVYFVAGIPVLTGTNNYAGYNQPIYSVINVGGDTYWHNYGTFTNSFFQLSFIGSCPAREDTTGYFGYQRKGQYGTVLFYPGQGGHNGNDYLISMSSSNLAFSAINTEWRNLKFLHPTWAKMGCLDNSYGGAFWLVDSEISGDWNGFSNLGGTQGEGWGDTNTYAVHLAVNSNNGDQRVDNCEIDTGYNGIYMNDHAYVVGKTTVVRFANALLAGFGLENYLDCRLDVNLTNIFYGCENGGGSRFNGHVVFSRDDTNPHHGVIWTPNASFLPHCDLQISDDFPSMFNIVVGTNEFQSPLGCNIYLSGYTAEMGSPNNMQSSSNFYGATLTMNHFPYGANGGSVGRDGKMDFSDPLIFGGGIGWIPGQKRIWLSGWGQCYFVMPDGGARFMSTNNVYWADIGSSGINLYTGTYAGSGSGLTNFSVTALANSGAMTNNQPISPGQLTYPLTNVSLFTSTNYGSYYNSTNNYFDTFLGGGNAGNPQAETFVYSPATFAPGNTAVGWGALASNTPAQSLIDGGTNAYGKYNTAVGFNALGKQTTGNHNTAVGWRAAQGNVSGIYNTDIGEDAEISNTTNSYSVAIGVHAMLNNVSGGGFDVGIGSAAMESALSSYGDVVVGYHAFQLATNYHNCVAIGYQACGLSTNGASQLTAVGYQALANADGGLGGDVAIGYQAGYNNYLSWHNIYIDNTGVNNDQYVTRIGTSQTKCYLAGTVFMTNCVVTNGITSLCSNLLAPSSITFPVSGANWTNTTGRNITVYIDEAGVTGTTTSINGTQIYSALVGDMRLDLQPGEYFSQTYTVGTPSAKIKPQ